MYVNYYYNDWYDDDDDDYYECETCDREFWSQHAANQHMTDLNHWAPRYGCQRCDRLFLSQQAANQHMAALWHWKPTANVVAPANAIVPCPKEERAQEMGGSQPPTVHVMFCEHLPNPKLSFTDGSLQVDIKPAELQNIPTASVQTSIEPVMANPQLLPQPIKREPIKTEPIKVKPTKVGLVKVELVKAEPAKSESVTPEPVESNPIKSESEKSMPDESWAKLVEIPLKPSPTFLDSASKTSNDAYNGFWWTCDSCQKRFGSAQLLRAHLNLSAHHEKVFSCPCSKQCVGLFPNLDGLLEHLKSRTCKFDGLFDSLERHEYQFTGFGEGWQPTEGQSSSECSVPSFEAANVGGVSMG